MPSIDSLLSLYTDTFAVEKLIITPINMLFDNSNWTEWEKLTLTESYTSSFRSQMRMYMLYLPFS